MALKHLNAKFLLVPALHHQLLVNQPYYMLKLLKHLDPTHLTLLMLCQANDHIEHQ